MTFKKAILCGCTGKSNSNDTVRWKEAKINVKGTDPFIWIEKNKVIIFFWKQFVYIFSRKKTVDVPCTFIVKNTLKVDTCCKKGKCFFLSTFSPRQYVNKSCTNLLTRIFNLYLCLNEILFSGFTGVAYLSSKGA